MDFIKVDKHVILNLFQNLKVSKLNNYETLKRACLPIGRFSLTIKKNQTSFFVFVRNLNVFKFSSGNKTKKLWFLRFYLDYGAQKSTIGNFSEIP